MTMKMAKASEADLDAAMALAGMFDALTDRWCPTIPNGDDADDAERFDSGDDKQCGRALRLLLETASRGSLFRVVFGAAVMLDPRNHCVDPDADTIEHHPHAQAGFQARIARPLADWSEDAGDVLWWRFPIDEPPYCGSPLDTDWPGYHTHWTPLIVPDAPTLKEAGR